jgi:hypothetical protein
MEGNIMSKKRRRFKESDGRKQIALTMKHRLVLIIAILLIILLVLIFRVGEVLWLGWMIAYRKQIIGLILFIILFLFFLSPIIIEADSNPRALSGPGKNPKGPRLE